MNTANIKYNVFQFSIHVSHAHVLGHLKTAARYVAARAHRVGPVHLLDLLINLSHGPPAVDHFADNRGVADTHSQGLNGLQVVPEPLDGHGLECPRAFTS